MRLLPLVLGLGLVSAPALAQGVRAPERVRAPFARLSDGGPRGVVELAWGAEGHARLAGLHARGVAFELEGLPLPGGLELRASLRPVSAFAPGARAVVVEADGEVRHVAPGIACFSGHVAGGGELFLGISDEQLHGYARVGSDLYFLTSGGSPRGRATLAHASTTGTAGAGFCGLAGGGALAHDLGDDVERALVAGVRNANVFIEADRAFRQLFPSTQACIDYSALLVTATSEVYRRDVGVRLHIPDGYLRVWNTTAPWGVITTFNDIGNVQAWWVSLANPDRNIPRASVHVLTTPVFGGVAWAIGGICNNSMGYEVSSVFGSFPYPIDHTNDDNWDLFVMAHEFGHSFGCEHSFDFSPPIVCEDGSGPDQGTIMSYCHLDFGTGAVGMRFHLREQQRIRSYVATVGCVPSQALLPGDYDADGARDTDDLLAANAVLVQGFRSLGAEETLDMDADGDFDVVDRDLLAALIGVGPASVTSRNGSGVNEECLLSFENPVMGTTWSASILAFGTVPTALWVHDSGHPGLPTPYGEFLLLPPGLGGVRLLTAVVGSDGLFANYDLPIPLTAALVGIEVSCQGIVVGGPSGTHLCNALDLVLNTFE